MKFCHQCQIYIPWLGQIAKATTTFFGVGYVLGVSRIDERQRRIENIPLCDDCKRQALECVAEARAKLWPKYLAWNITHCGYIALKGATFPIYGHASRYSI